MKPDQKAYKINTRDLDRSNESIRCGYIEHFYAADEKQARRIALSIAYEHDLKTWLDEDLTYITIKVKRAPEFDKYLVDGAFKTMADIKYDQDKKEHEDKIRQMLIDNPHGFAYIKKGGYYYCPNHCGYTEYRNQAGVYTMADAVKECLGMSLRDYMRPEPIDIAEHNKMIQGSIDKLKLKLI